MKESIYTIPVNEVFEESAEKKDLCPFCRLYKRLQENELELILGASMMDPDIRIRTNKMGFCSKHFSDMLKRGNRLSLGLILESHVNEIFNDINGADFLKYPGSSAIKRISALESECYVCTRIEDSFKKMVETAVLLWKEESDFRKKFNEQPHFCLPHFAMYAEEAKNRLDKKTYPMFYKGLKEITFKYMEELSGDVSWFCKKFDYRYSEEPWGNSKDAIERAIKLLCSDSENEEEKKKK